MTANELLDKLRSASIKLLGKETEHAGRAIILYRESAIMLQHQQDEIETLKAEIIMQNERWKKIHSKERELEMKYSDEWWVEVALLNKTFPFKMTEFEDEKICLLKEILKNVSKQKTS